MPHAEDTQHSWEEHARLLVHQPREALAVELKSWFDPNTPEGVSRVVKGLLALRNQGGGFFLVGFDDETHQPLAAPWPDVNLKFHQDTIQALVSKYASQPFETSVLFMVRDGQTYPVIRVDAGVRCPVGCKADLKSVERQDKFLLRENDIFVRTLNSNGTVSSARASWRDLEDLMQRCFDNREEDYARFFNKVFRGITPESAQQIFAGMAALSEQGASSGPTLQQIWKEGDARFQAVVNERGVDLSGIGFFDVVMRIKGTMPAQHHANQEFLRLIRISNPELTGWPIWLVSSDFSDEDSRPYPFEKRWEQFIYRKRPVLPERGWGHLDFMIFDPVGAFFLRRGFQDDMRQASATQSLLLDPILYILRVAEALAVGRAFAKALGCGPENTLSFLFRWSGLKDRHLEPWSAPERHFMAYDAAVTDSVETQTVISPESTDAEIVKHTHKIMVELTREFGGYDISEEVVKYDAESLLQRRL